MFRKITQFSVLLMTVISTAASAAEYRCVTGDFSVDEIRISTSSNSVSREIRGAGTSVHDDYRIVSTSRVSSRGARGAVGQSFGLELLSEHSREIEGVIGSLRLVRETCEDPMSGERMRYRANAAYISSSGTVEEEELEYYCCERVDSGAR